MAPSRRWRIPWRRMGRIGAVGPRIYLENGTLDHGCKRGFPTPWNAFCYFSGLSRRMKKHPEKYDGYALRYLDEWQRHEVDAISGSCMMIPKHVFEQVGGFDERYFMYAEDLDLCYVPSGRQVMPLYISPRPRCCT